MVVKINGAQCNVKTDEWSQKIVSEFVYLGIGINGDYEYRQEMENCVCVCVWHKKNLKEINVFVKEESLSMNALGGCMGAVQCHPYSVISRQ